MIVRNYRAAFRAQKIRVLLTRLAEAHGSRAIIIERKFASPSF
jgi:indole-3-glycerol phosphate synthase